MQLVETCIQQFMRFCFRRKGGEIESINNDGKLHNKTEIENATSNEYQLQTNDDLGLVLGNSTRLGSIHYKVRKLRRFSSHVCPITNCYVVMLAVNYDCMASCHVVTTLM